MKVLIAGGRDFLDADAIVNKLNELAEQGIIDETIEGVSGEAAGADATGRDILEASGFYVHKFPANWQDMSEPCVRKVNAYGEYNALAGNKRNKTMGDFADIAIICWDGKSTGTQDMLMYMNSLGKPVYLIRY